MKTQKELLPLIFFRHVTVYEDTRISRIIFSYYYQFGMKELAGY